MKNNDSVSNFDLVKDAISFFLTLRESDEQDYTDNFEFGGSVTFENQVAQLAFVDMMLTEILSDDSQKYSEQMMLGVLIATSTSQRYGLGASLFSDRVSDELRFDVLKNIEKVFTHIFPKWCEPSIRNETKSEWNHICYMWWDEIPRFGALRDSHLYKLDHEIVCTLGRILEVDHIACKESALHGLGHWATLCGDEVVSTIDQHVDQIPVALKEYAQRARTGNVQ